MKFKQYKTESWNEVEKKTDVKFVLKEIIRK